MIAPLLLAACAAPPTGHGGIVSLNPCTDAMLLQLVPEHRIAAISHYSRDPEATSIPIDVARRLPVTAGTAEEVIALDPDLVVATSFTPPATRAAFARAGLRTLYLDAPATVAASAAQVRALAATVAGEPAAGERLAKAIAASIAPVRAGRRPRALLFITGDLANGSGTLLDDMMTRAGFENAAARYGLAFTGTLPAEAIVGRQPDVIIAPSTEGRGAALRHRLLPAVPTATFERRLVNCGGPSIPAAMARLRAIRATLS